MPKLLPPPKFREFTAIGDAPLIGGTVETYEAGTSTPVSTFIDSTGASANPWPVVLDSTGRADIWIADGAAVKVVVKDSTGTTVYTVDDVSGVGSGDGGSGGTTQASEWLVQAETPSFVSGTSYTITGDVRDVHHAGRRVRAQVSAGLTYHTITDSTFGTGVTTVTVTNDSTPLDAGLSSVAVGILSADNPSASVDCISGLGSLTVIQSGMVVMTAAATPDTGFVWCDGTLYDGTDPTYTPLWNRIGATFGGTGQDSFAVPNMNGRMPIGFGAATGLTTRSLGDTGGEERHALTEAENGPHEHTTTSSSSGGGGGDPRPSGSNIPFAGMTPVATSSSGTGDPHENMSPFLTMGFEIKL